MKNTPTTLRAKILALIIIFAAVLSACGTAAPAEAPKGEAAPTTAAEAAPTTAPATRRGRLVIASAKNS